MKMRTIKNFSLRQGEAGHFYLGLYSGDSGPVFVDNYVISSF